jgi:uncharacterized protein
MNYQTKYLKENDFTKKKNVLISLKPTCLLFITQIGFAQFTIPEKPSLATSVYANVLSSTEKLQLEEKLIQYSDSTTTNSGYYN